VSRIAPLRDALLAAGFNVQLNHEPKETSFADHGRVQVVGPDGETLAEVPDYQQNPFYSRRDQKLQAMMSQLASRTSAASG